MPRVSVPQPEASVRAAWYPPIRGAAPQTTAIFDQGLEDRAFGHRFDRSAVHAIKEDAGLFAEVTPT